MLDSSDLAHGMMNLLEIGLFDVFNAFKFPGVSCVCAQLLSQKRIVTIGQGQVQALTQADKARCSASLSHILIGYCG